MCVDDSMSVAFSGGLLGVYIIVGNHYGYICLSCLLNISDRHSSNNVSWIIENNEVNDRYQRNEKKPKLPPTDNRSQIMSV